MITLTSPRLSNPSSWLKSSSIARWRNYLRLSSWLGSSSIVHWRNYSRLTEVDVGRLNINELLEKRYNDSKLQVQIYRYVSFSHPLSICPGLISTGSRISILFIAMITLTSPRVSIVIVKGLPPMYYGLNLVFLLRDGYL